MRGGFYLENTAGENSRQSKITAAQARRIIREFAAGKRGKANAHRFGITPGLATTSSGAAMDGKALAT